MSYDQKNYAIETTRYALIHCGNAKSAAIYVKNRFEAVYGGYWTCIISICIDGAYASNYCPKYQISFTMGKYHVCIYKQP